MSRRLRLPAILLNATLLWCTAATAEEEKPRPAPADTWYAQALARGDAGLGVTHFWSKGPKLRAETVVAGHKIVTIVNGPTYYAYDGTSGQGIAIERDASALEKDRRGRRPFGNEYERLLELGAELVREEKRLGQATGVYRLTDEFGRRELWVTQDELRIPLRIEIYNRATTQRTTTDYLNWQSGLSIEDAFFEPDPRAKLEAMDYATYAKRTATEGPVGPVPVLYRALLYADSASP